MNDIQDLIRQLRDRGWTISAISKEISVAGNTVDRWCHGSRYPANTACVKVSLSQLLRRQVPKRQRVAKVTS